MSTGKQPKTRV